MIARLITGSSLLALALAAQPVLAKTDDAPWTLQDALGDPEGLKVSASVRVRYEALENQFRPGLDKNDDLITLQTDLAAEFDTGPIRIGGEVMDSRAYAADPGSSVGTGEVNALEPVQAYIGADFGSLLGQGTTTSIDAGRFTLNFGSRRLVARNNFRNTTNAFTGVKLEFRGKGKEQLTLFYTYPQQRLPEDKASIIDNHVEWDHEGDDLIFWGGFFSKPGIAGPANLELYFYGLDEDDTATRATRDRHLFTPGFRLYRDPAKGSFDYQLEYAHQFGTISTSSAPGAPKQDVSAHTLHAEAGYQFASSWQPRLALEYDLGTGDKPGGDYGRFDALYGARRPDWGPSAIYGPLGRSNIRSPGVRLEVKPSPRWDGFVEYRAAWLDSATDSFASTGIRDATGASGTFAGHQIQARARYWVIPKMLRFDGGGAVLLNGRFLQDAPNSNHFGDVIYTYLDLTLTI